MIYAETEGPLATLTISRPEKKNAFDIAMMEQFATTLDKIAVNESVRCVIVSGEGDDFSSGADLSEFTAIVENAELASVFQKSLTALFASVRDCPHPVIASVRGACLGGGLLLACCADIRVCSRSSRFGITANRLGITVPIIALDALLQVVGLANSLQLVLEGLVYDAAYADKLGLITHQVEDEELKPRTLDIAMRIVNGAPLANRWNKEFIYRLWRQAALNDNQFEKDYRFLDTEDFRSGLTAYLNKRSPEFVGR